MGGIHSVNRVHSVGGVLVHSVGGVGVHLVGEVHSMNKVGVPQ